MATYRQLAYMIADFSKSIADDTIVNIDHIIFLMSRYRTFILNNAFANVKKALSDSNYQTICIPLNNKACYNEDFCGKEEILRSVDKVPLTMVIGSKTINPPAGFMYGNLTYVPTNRFRYAGNNSFLKNFIYVTIGPDRHIYLKSANEDFAYLQKVVFTAVFEDIEKASMMECDCDGECSDKCELLDKKFPLDDAYMITLMQLCIKDITGALWKPKDDENDSADNTARFAQILGRYTTQAFKNQMNGDNGQQ